MAGHSSVITDIGRRVELVPMDAHCHDISIALYLQDGPAGLVHTYSSRPGAAERIAFVAGAMRALGGLEEDGEARVRFPCRSWHAAAARRAFLEACKLDSSSVVAPRPLEVSHARTGQLLRAEPLGEGRYRIVADGVAEGTASRAPAVAAGLAKLAELEIADDPTVVSFPCGEAHDALVGMLLPRALNVRQTLREQEALSSRGVLSAPSASQEG